ncbi:MAG TPA: dihydrodipicolinate synthase family protein [Gemmatimonadaceae bacterium]
MTAASFDLRAHLLAGQVIPAHPLALDAAGHLDERHQRALTRYYASAGAGGIAVGVHTTQFAIRDRGLLEPVLSLAADALDAIESDGRPRMARVAGVCGLTGQAVAEAALARDRGYHAGLLSYAGWGDAGDDAMLTHARAVGEIIPVFGFYLQPAVGGRPLGYDFWRRFAELDDVAAIKIAPFNRYATWDVVRAVGDADRRDVALYTGNDDSIVADLLTAFPNGLRMAGGLLGQWAVWTRRAVDLLRATKAGDSGGTASHWLARGAALTDANAAIFDAANGFAGCIAGIQEVLFRQGLLRSTRCLDGRDVLSRGQADAITRVCTAYPDLLDDEFVCAHLDEWLR